MNSFHQFLRRFAVLVTLLSWFCAAGYGEELNSERIERLFGSYGVAIVHQSGVKRISCLYSLSGDQQICRTLAVVSFVEPMPEPLLSVHGEIRSGASIGATLKQNGWQINKINRYIGSVQFPADARFLASSMHIQVPATLPMHVYRLVASRGDQNLPYATLIEVHHPDFHTRESLEQVYQDLPGEPASAEEVAAFKAHFRAAVPR